MKEYEECEKCEGTGRVEVLYCDCHGCGGMSNDQAMMMAGEVHHVEACEPCGGTGEIEIEDEEGEE